MSTIPIKRYLQEAYTDERLAQLLAHTEDGKLSYNSCCCLIGAATANHALKAASSNYGGEHYAAAKTLDGKINGYEKFAPYSAFYKLSAEVAYHQLAATDEGRRAALLPMIREEIERRDGVRSLLKKWGVKHDWSESVFAELEMVAV